jgi:hypothetical protein
VALYAQFDKADRWAQRAFLAAASPEVRKDLFKRMQGNDIFAAALVNPTMSA